MKLHPQEVLDNNTKSMVTEYAMLKLTVTCHTQCCANERKLQSELLRWRWWSIWHMGGGGWLGVWKTQNAGMAGTVKVSKLTCACSLEY